MSSSSKAKTVQTNPFYFSDELGYFAGLIWGGLHWLMYVLHFTKVIPGFLAEPFFKHGFLVTPAGHLLGYLFFIVFSVLASLIYVLIFRSLTGLGPDDIRSAVVVGPVPCVFAPIPAPAAVQAVVEHGHQRILPFPALGIIHRIYGGNRVYG